jgi:GH15 family glucan-1,4-alpha-glucosidase
MADRYHAIEDHAIIGDLHTVALVATDGTIDWCCLPRFDSPAVFASLLDADRGGSFSVQCRAERTKQLYMPESNVLVTRFLGADSVGEVVDFMVPHDGGLSSTSWPHRLVRRLRAVRGTVEFDVRCAPAFNFAQASHSVQPLDHGGVIFTTPGAEMVLRSTRPLSVEGSAATAVFRLECGEGVDLILEWGGRIRPPVEGEAEMLFDRTLEYWRTWLRRSRYHGRYREMIERSALVLKLLVYQPTGALVAAPTTSLPESIGGGRNWDYRYTWIRDAAFTLYGLMRLGFMEEAASFMSWLEARCQEAPPKPGSKSSMRSTGTPRSPSRSSTTWRATAALARSGSGTPPPGNSRSTSTARSWTRCTCSTSTAIPSPTTSGSPSPGSWTGWRSTGSSPTTASGRPGAAGSGSPTRP